MLCDPPGPQEPLPQLKCLKCPVPLAGEPTELLGARPLLLLLLRLPAVFSASPDMASAAPDCINGRSSSGRTTHCHTLLASNCEMLGTPAGTCTPAASYCHHNLAAELAASHGSNSRRSAF